MSLDAGSSPVPPSFDSMLQAEYTPRRPYAQRHYLIYSTALPHFLHLALYHHLRTA